METTETISFKQRCILMLSVPCGNGDKTLVPCNCDGNTFDDYLRCAYGWACEHDTTVEFEKDGIYVQMTKDSVLDMIRDELFLAVAHYICHRSIGPGQLLLSNSEREYVHCCLFKEFKSDSDIEAALPTYNKLILRA